MVLLLATFEVKGHLGLAKSYVAVSRTEDGGVDIKKVISRICAFKSRKRTIPITTVTIAQHNITHKVQKTNQSSSDHISIFKRNRKCLITDCHKVQLYIYIVYIFVVFNIFYY